MRVSEGISHTSEAQLRNALDAMPHKVWMVRPEGPALYYNRAMRAALEVPLAEAVRGTQEIKPFAPAMPR